MTGCLVSKCKGVSDSVQGQPDEATSSVLEKSKVPFRDPPFCCPSILNPSLPAYGWVGAFSKVALFKLHPATPPGPGMLSSEFPAVLKPCQQQTEASLGALGGEKALHYATVTHLAQAQSSPDGLQGLLILVPCDCPLENSHKHSHPATAEGHQQKPTETGPCPVAL